MVVYVDTSVIIAAVDRGDIRNRDAEKFLLREKEKVVSPFALAEIFSVVSRNFGKLEVDVDEDDLPAVIARLCMKKYGLKLISSFDKELTIFGELPAEFKLVFILASKLKLRTLDLLHVSYAWNLKLNGHGIDEFATFDGEILDNAREIKKLIGIHVFEP